MKKYFDQVEFIKEVWNDTSCDRKDRFVQGMYVGQLQTVEHFALNDIKTKEDGREFRKLCDLISEISYDIIHYEEENDESESI